MSRHLVVYVVSDIDKALAFEWITEALDEKRFELRFVLLNAGPSQLEEYLKEKGVVFERVVYSGKHHLATGWMKLFLILLRWRPKVVHCHLFTANLLGLTASWLLGVPVRLFTRHHGSLHHRSHPKGVLLDRLCNKLATGIIAISENVRTILIKREGVNPSKVHLVNHGFRWSELREQSTDQVELLRTKYELQGRGPVVGLISRLVDWKGIQYAVRAFQGFRCEHPAAVLVLANATGPFAGEIRRELDALPADSYRLIPFEPNIGCLYRLFDVFVHVPIDPEVEAFGQIYVEALAAEVPSIFTMSGIGAEIAVHEQNCLVVPFEDSDAIGRALLRLGADESLRRRLIIGGWSTVSQRFSLESMVSGLQALYE